MAVSIHVPRVNNNDDEVKLISLRIAVGDAITRGQLIAEVETDKAIVEVEAPNHGFVLAVAGNVDDILTVGSILLWLGERPDEPIPSLVADASPSTQGPAGQPTAKARRVSTIVSRRRTNHQTNSNRTRRPQFPTKSLCR